MDICTCNEGVDRIAYRVNEVKDRIIIQEDLDRIDEGRIELVMRMWTALIVGRTDLVMRMHCFCCWYLVDLMLVSRRARQERPSTNVNKI